MFFRVQTTDVEIKKKHSGSLMVSVDQLNSSFKGKEHANSQMSVVTNTLIEGMDQNLRRLKHLLDHAFTLEVKYVFVYELCLSRQTGSTA